jgi:hypothetical protein
MPLVNAKARKTTWRADEIVTAWQSFSVATPRGDQSVGRGEELRGDHPAVKAAPAYFVPQGTPEGEWPSPFEAAGEVAQETAIEHHAELARRYPEIDRPPLALEDAVRATMDVHLGGRTIAAGAILSRDDKVVQLGPDYFEPVAEFLARGGG